MTTDSNAWCEWQSWLMFGAGSGPAGLLRAGSGRRRLVPKAAGAKILNAAARTGSHGIIDEVAGRGDGAEPRFVQDGAIPVPRHPVASSSRSRMDDPADPAADLRLVQAFLAGKQDAVRKIAERLQCVARILAAENARLGRPLDAHDLADTVQDTMLVLLRKLRTYEGRGVLEAWVFHTCRFELLNAVRRRRRQMPNLAEDAVAEAPSAGASREWQRIVAREAIETALQRIGGADAEALRLRHFEGLSIAEMAVRTGTSPVGMKARYYRALSRLEQVLGAQEHREDNHGGAAGTR